MFFLRRIGLGTVQPEAEQDMFETLVDELLKEKPDSRKVKTLCGKLGIQYVKNNTDQIEEIIRNGSKIYLKSRSDVVPTPKLNHAKSL